MRNVLGRRWRVSVVVCLAVAVALAMFLVAHLVGNRGASTGTAERGSAVTVTGAPTSAAPTVTMPEGRTVPEGRTEPPRGAPAPATPAPSSGLAAELPAGGTFASPPERLTIAAAALDVTVLPLTPDKEALAEQALVPPLTEDGYWLTPYGTPGQGSDNTTYITGHSWNDREAPFDRLSTQTEIGDAVSVTTAAGVLRYAVDSVTTYDKDTLKDSEIWNIVPNRLVLISCYTDDPEGKNVVVTASPIH